MSKTEVQLISSVCKDKDILTALSTDIDEMFLTHGDVWDWVRTYYFKYGSVPDVEIVKDNFRDFDALETKADTGYYIDQMRDNFLTTALKQEMYEIAKQIKKRPGVESLALLNQKIANLTRQASVVRDLDLTDVDDAAKHFERKKALADAMGGLPGIPSGFKVMDTFYPSGMAGGHLIVVIGWSGKGKTLFSTYLACKAWEAGFKPMIVSLEMSPEQMRDRVYAMLGSGIFSMNDLQKGDINIDEFNKWGKRKLGNKHPFTIVSSEGAGRVTPNTVQAKIDQHKPDLVILDYQQLFDDNEGNQNEVSRNRNISRDFKRMATRNNIPVINLSQATQQSPKDTQEPPRIEQVAWSKGIQHDADLALAVHKYEDSDTMDVIARKNRHGQEFAFELEWDINLGKVEEVL